MEYLENKNRFEGRYIAYGLTKSELLGLEFFSTS